MAQLEAASVDAFHLLRSDLARHGAPRHMLRSIDAAAADEIRHARTVGRAAERFGACVPPVSVAPGSPRSLEQLAIDNAGEGCVTEAFGAAIATLQSERASDPRVRRMLRAIARDEIEHAALAWRIADWLDARLDAGACARVLAARRTAVEALRAGLETDAGGDDVLGLPDSGAVRAVLSAMEEALVTGDLARAA